MDYQELMAKFGERCGVGDLQPDADGVASIQADDIFLSFMELPAARQLVMFADVAEKPDGNLERLYEVLLESQYLGGVMEGACFSISLEGNIALHRTAALADLDVEELMKRVESFLNLIDKWRAIITAYRPEAEQPAEEGAWEQGHVALGGNDGFISV